MVRLKNFRSFGEVELDLRQKDSVPKKLAIIYGENGAGKSNLMSAFVLLQELLDTMNVRDVYEKILSQTSTFDNEEIEKAVRQRLMSGLRDMQTIIDDYSMVGGEFPVVAEYEFNIGGNAGKYCVELGKEELVYERLEYRLNKRRGVYFECKKGSISINAGIIKDRDFLGDIKKTAKRFWGKHSILAILLHEIYDKSEAYAQENISGNFSDVLYEFRLMSSVVRIGTRSWDHTHAPFDIFEEPIKGEIPIAQENELNVAEEVFTTFFSAINSNIEKAYYERIYNDNLVKYRLYLKKYISEAYRSIPFELESTGNYRLIKVLCCILTACMGGTIVIDEADMGIHDLLFQKIIEETQDLLEGQLIITTHNTMLMESKIPQDSIYIIVEETPGKKQVRCINDYRKRTYISNNIRNKYLNNEYGGLPEVHEVNYEALIKEISKAVENTQA